VTDLKDVVLTSHTHTSTTQASEKRDKILKWLKSTDPSLNHYAAC
jgi:hypothetical protein